MKKDKCDIIIAGVGGQGILLSSDILGEACISENIPVRGAEVHGMAQRGGAVEAHVRIGCVYGPKIPEGEADILIAMEPLEGARFSFYLKKNGAAVINSSQIPLLGGVYKTEDTLEIIKAKTSNVASCDFTAEAVKAGSAKTLNVIMLGAVLKLLPLSEETLVRAIEATVKKDFVDMNIEALNKGVSMNLW